MKFNEVNPGATESEFMQTLKNIGKTLINNKATMKKEAAKQNGINTKLIAKIALASGHYNKIGFDAYQQEIGNDPGSIWYLSTDASGEQWLVKDVDEKGDIIRHLVSEKLPVNQKKVASKLGGIDFNNPQSIFDSIIQLNNKYVELTGNSLMKNDGLSETDLVNLRDQDEQWEDTNAESMSTYDEPTRTDVANIDTLIKTYGYENLTPSYQKYARFLVNKGLIKNSAIKTAAPEDFLLPNSAPQVDDMVKPMEWVTDSKQDTELSDEEKKDKAENPGGAIDPNAQEDPNQPQQQPPMDSNMMEAQNDVRQELGEGKGDVEIKINPQELTSFTDFPNTPSKIDEKKPAVPLDMQQVEPLFDPSQPIEETRRPSAEKKPSPEVY